MALKPKTGSLRIRIDPELLERYRVVCEDRGWTVSDGIRRHMQDVVGQQYQRALQTQSASQETSTALPVSLPTKAVVDGSGQSDGDLVRKPLSLSERRKAEKLAKQAKLARRQDRY